MRYLVLGPLPVLLAAGCSTDAGPEGTGTAAGTGGQVASTGGSATVAGTSSASGSASGGAAAGQMSTGGSLSTGGTAANGGNGGAAGGAGGAAGGAGPTGGAAGAGGMSGGAGGAGGGGGGGPSTAPKPSAGCGKAGSALGSAASPLTVSGHQYYVKLPGAYDANKPYPVLFMFHPTNNPIDWAEKNAGYEQNGAKDAAIRVYPASASNSSGWVASDVAFFAPLYDKVTGDYCIDKARAFATGESSGGDFSSILGCEHADKLRAVAPCSTKDVPQYPLNAASRKCTGEVASIVIQGKNDNVVGPENGPKTRDFYVALNHCGTMTTPVAGYTDTLSNCVMYQGCDAGYPVYWCQHTDPNYSNTNHGWPAFAAKMTWEVFSKY